MRKKGLKKSNQIQIKFSFANSFLAYFFRNNENIVNEWMEKNQIWSAKEKIKSFSIPKEYSLENIRFFGCHRLYERHRMTIRCVVCSNRVILRLRLMMTTNGDEFEIFFCFFFQFSIIIHRRRFRNIILSFFLFFSFPF